MREHVITRLIGIIQIPEIPPLYMIIREADIAPPVVHIRCSVSIGVDPILAAGTFRHQMRTAVVLPEVRRCNALGVRDFKSYDARRSVISWLQATPGISPAAIQAFAGWLRITTQEAYGARSPNDGLPALEAMEGLTVGVPGLSKVHAATPECMSGEGCAGLFDDIDM